MTLFPASRVVSDPQRSSPAPGSASLTRAGMVSRLGDGALDVLVVGGGITGAGVARDAAMRGLRVALVEQYDFASGASGGSSRLIHGGIRHLSQGHLLAVWHALRERHVLQTIAPHLAQPMAFVLPCYKDSSWSWWQLRLGVRIYDGVFAGRRSERGSILGADEAVRHLAGLERRDLSGAVRYHGCFTNDARLVLDTLRSAARYGAAVCNYTRFEGAEPDGLDWRCRLSLEEGGTAEVRARCVVNASGVWSPGLSSSSRIEPTKGVHVVLDRARLPVGDAVVMARKPLIIFAVPWGERIILGATDTPWTGTPESVRVEERDVADLLAAANRCFPQAGLRPEHVLSSWASLRPLLPRDGGPATDMVRSHRIHMPRPGWIDVSGGNLTVHRYMAQRVVDLIARRVGRALEPCRTAREPLLDPADAPGMSGVAPPEVTPAAVRHFCRAESALHLSDVLLRRTGWETYFGRSAALSEKVARWMGDVLGWDERRIERECAGHAGQGSAGAAQASAPAPTRGA